MKTTNQFSIVISFATLGLVSCATATPTIQTGADAEISYDGLHRVTGCLADEVWAVPDLDLSQFTKLKLEGAGIEYRPGDRCGPQN